MKKFKNYVFDMPKTPLRSYLLYLKEKTSDLRKKRHWSSEKIREVALEEWEDNDELQLEYKKKAEENQKEFKRQLNEFYKFGYYIKNNNDYILDDDDDTEEEKKVKTEKKKNRKYS